VHWFWPAVSVALAVLIRPGCCQSTLESVPEELRSLGAAPRRWHVRAACEVTICPAPGAAQRQYESQLELWHSGHPLGPLVVQAMPEVVRSDGDSYIEEHYTLTYDGRVSVKHMTALGTRGAPKPWPHATVTPGRHDGFPFLMVMMGWTATPFGLFEERGLRFSEMIVAAAARGMLNMSQRTDGMCVLVIGGEATRGSSIRIVADPHADFAFREVVHTKEGRTLRTIAIGETSGVGELRYPRDIVDTLCGPDGAPMEIRHTRILSCSLMSREEWEARVLISLPGGTVVDDRAMRSKFTVARPVKELDEELASMAEAVQGLRRSHDPAQESAGWQSWIVGLLAFCAVAAIALLVACVRRNRQAVAVLFTLTALTQGQALGQRPSTFAAGSVTALRMVPGWRVENCGVAATALVLRLLGDSLAIQTVADLLGAGDHWEGQVNLLEIGECLRARGHSAVGMGSVASQNVVECLRRAPESWMVVQVKARRAHFVVLQYDGNGQIVIADPMGKVRRARPDDTQDKIWSAMNSTVLLVRKEGGGRRGVDLEGEAQETVIIDEDSTGEVVNAYLDVRNDSDKEWNILDAKSSCGCFVGLELESGGRTLAAKMATRVVVKMNAAKMKQASDEQVVYVSHGYSGTTRKIGLEIRVTTRRLLALQDDLAAAPLLVPEYWRLAESAGEKPIEIEGLCLVIPEGWRMDTIHHSDGIKSVDLIAAHGLEGRVALTFAATLVGGVEPVRQRVEFLLSGKRKLTLSCVIEGPSSGR